MGVLTTGMARLHGEIVASQHAREMIMKDLARGTKDLRKAVTGMLGVFHNTHARMARTSKADCARFIKGVETTVHGLKTTVAGLRKEFSTDLAGARRAWQGKAGAVKAARRNGRARKTRRG